MAVLVELKARFDEESNIGWARALEADGVHVIYGLLGLKTHSKVALVVRREGERLARYVHLATGNYNAITALAYTDLGLLTADAEIGEDATQLFNYLTGYAHPKDFRRLLVAPVNLRERLVELIDRVGRFLEHSRVFWFRNAGAEEVYLGSADLMLRNLSRRVEVLFPVRDPALVRHLRDAVLGTYLADNVRARRMRPDGGYDRVRPREGEPAIDAQARLLRESAGRLPDEAGR